MEAILMSIVGFGSIILNRQVDRYCPMGTTVQAITRCDTHGVDASGRAMVNGSLRDPSDRGVDPNAVALSRVGLRSKIFSCSLRGTGSRGGKARHSTKIPIKAFHEANTPVTPRVYVSTRTITRTRDCWGRSYRVVYRLPLSIPSVSVTSPSPSLSSSEGFTEEILGRPYSSGSIPLPDLGVVEVDRGFRFTFFFTATRSKCSGRSGGSSRSAASSAALVAGLLYFLLLPAVGCPLPDAMCEYLLSKLSVLISRTFWLKVEAVLDGAQVRTRR